MSRDAPPLRNWLFLVDPDAWYEIWTTLRQNKLRAFLTACGVFWGIFMLVVMLGLGNGLRANTINDMGGLLIPTVYVWSRRTTMAYAGFRPGRSVQLNNADIAAIAAVPGVDEVEPRIRLGEWRGGVNVSSGNKTSNFAVLGDTPAYLRVEPVSLPRGRFINQLDMQEQRKVAVIGEQVRHYFFGDDADAIGRYVQVKGVHFQIVGEIADPKTGDEGDKLSASVIIPFSTFQTAFNSRDQVHWFTLTAQRDAFSPDVEKRVRQTLAARHRIHPDDDQAFGSFNVAEKNEQVLGLFRGIQIFVWFVGVLTLLAGVLGVSNILLIIVKERTKEIGIRKALGAPPIAIVGLIVEEALALTSLAGYCGLVAGVGLLEIARRAFKDQGPLVHAGVDLKAALVATAVLILAALAAAVVPARHAAGVHPVEALRAE
jgi:putative ABC transport system permease protein